MESIIEVYVYDYTRGLMGVSETSKYFKRDTSTGRDQNKELLVPSGRP